MLSAPVMGIVWSMDPVDFRVWWAESDSVVGVRVVRWFWLVSYRVDSPTGPLLGNFAIGNTGGWNSVSADPGECDWPRRRP